MKRAIAFGLYILLASGAGTATAQPGPDAATFARTASASDAFEIQSSRLALERTRNPRVRVFAQRMMNDHSRTTAELSQTAPALVMFAGPGMPDERHAAMLSQLSSQSGPAFDRLYGQMQVAAHREAIALFSSYAASGDEPRLVSFARSTLPALRHHLAMARRL
ncbi:DUF4142 domain-containing protein [Bradyrhizobium sp. STM 3562]|uniref:DUF4142 domain-containing protein n=1 Tax=Bradyrhizobium sp. STM 3562 TaxID=578924 RepID=UPI00388F8A28